MYLRTLERSTSCLLLPSATITAHLLLLSRSRLLFGSSTFPIPMVCCIVILALIHLAAVFLMHFLRATTRKLARCVVCHVCRLRFRIIVVAHVCITGVTRPIRAIFVVSFAIFVAPLTITSAVRPVVAVATLLALTSVVGTVASLRRGTARGAAIVVCYATDVSAQVTGT